MNLKFIVIIFFSFSFFQYKEKVQNENKKNISEVKVDRKLAKFEPKDGVLLFVGQELEAIRGLEDYNDGYNWLNS